MACDDWDAVSITDCQLSKKEIEQLVGMAVAEQLAADGPTSGGAAAAAEAGATPDAAAPAAAAADAASPPAVEGSTSMDVVQQQADATAAVTAEAAASTIEAPATREREASATVDEQPAAMQTDGDEATAPAAAGSAPADGTVAQPAAEGPGTAAAVAAAGEAAKAQQPWTLRAEHVMAAAEALRKLQAEAASQSDKQALRDVAVDQYEKQLLSEVSLLGMHCWEGIVSVWIGKRPGRRLGLHGALACRTRALTRKHTFGQLCLHPPCLLSPFPLSLCRSSPQMRSTSPLTTSARWRLSRTRCTR